MTASEISIEPHNVTIIGAFNPDILSPEWAIRYLGVPGGDGRIAVNPAGGRLVQVGSLTWLPSHERVQVHGEMQAAGRFVSKLAEVLPHTPFSAVGVNFQFSGELESISACGPWGWGLDIETASGALGGTVGELSLSHAVAREDGVRVKLTVEQPLGGPETVLSLNYHRQVSPAGTLSQGQDASSQVIAHVAKAKEFEADADRIRRMIFG